MTLPLQVSGLTKVFGSVTAVDHLDFDVMAGECLGLLGVNGAGKTTTMNMILGLLTPTAGEISIFGHDLKKDRITALGLCNFSSAYTSLPANLLVWQNLDVFARIYGVRNRKEKIESLLEMFEISHLYKRVTGMLSAGESTRLNLCKALLNEPKMLLLDEPTASLDPDIADKVRTTLTQVRQQTGISMLYTSHNMRDVEEVCNRILFIHHGRILFMGSGAEMLERFGGESLEDVFISIARSRDGVAL